MTTIRNWLKRRASIRKFYRILRKYFPIIFFRKWLASKYRSWFYEKKFTSDLTQRDAIMQLNSGPFTKVFFRNRNFLSQKWSHYFSFYDELASQLLAGKNNHLHILEIGVQNGGSLAIWRELFGPNSLIYGVDIDPECGKLDIDAKIYIGSSSDRDFLQSICKDAQYFDLVIDDGSHDSKHQKIAFETIYPFLSENGTYIIEDIEHSYYYSKHGGYLRPSSIIEVSKRFIDKLNKDFFRTPFIPSFKVKTTNLYSILFLKGLIVIRNKKSLKSSVVWNKS